MRTLLLAAALQGAVGFSGAEAAAVLRAHATVDGETVRLGDLFDGAGALADKPVATAPRMGTRMVIGSIDLAALARDNGLDWAPEAREQRIVVERAGTPVPIDVIVASLQKAAGPDKQVDLDSGTVRLLVPTGAPTTVAVDQLTVDPRTGRLTADVSAPAGSSAAQHVKVSGRVRATVEVPVMRRAVLPGEVVRRQDVTYASVPADQVANGIIADPGDIVGKISRTMLRQDQPVHRSEIQMNSVVRRNDLVRVVVSLPGLDVTTQGKALEDGAVGQSIRVLNTASNMTIQATVRGAGDVSVVPGAAPGGR